MIDISVFMHATSTIQTTTTKTTLYSLATNNKNTLLLFLTISFYFPFRFGFSENIKPNCYYTATLVDLKML